MVDFKAIRAQFPILDQEIHGHPLVYLDSAATSQKPNAVIDAEANFYRTINAGVHRGAHELAARSTMAFEEARAKVAKLVGANAAEGEEEVVVTGGATAGLNLLATAFGNASLGRGGEAAKRFALKPGDEIVVSRAEHHSVLLPFQELSYRTGATFKWIDLTEDGRVRTDNLDEVITERTKVVAVTHVGNATGAITNIAPIIKRAHEVGSIFILDACQSVPHLKVDFHALDVDFAAWSAHKMYGPTGVGFLYGKRDLLEALPPANFGGSVVELAYMDHEAQYMAPPARFEAGTQPVAQVVAAGVAAEWMMNIGLENIEAHEKTIAAELLKLGDVDGIRILGPRENVDRIGTVAFDVAGVHPHDVGQFIDAQGIAIRVGHHCAQPVHRHFGLYASNRASPVSTIRSKMPKRWSKRPRASVSSWSGVKQNTMNEFGMSGDDLEQMYQEVILEASKHPHGKESFAPNAAVEQSADAAANVTVQASHEYCTPGESHQFNPTCGDEATIHVEVSDDEPHTIKRLVWDGHGCSISQASLSVMVDLVDGKTVDEAMDLEQTFHKLMESRGAGLDDENLEEKLGDAVVFQGVSKYPMRIKCALLGWEGLKDSIAKALAAKN